MFDTKCCIKKENLVEKIAFVFKLYSIETNRAKPQNSIPLDVEKHEIILLQNIKNLKN